MSLKLSMARRNLTIGMSDTGMSSRHIAVQFNVNHTVIGRLIQRYHQTGTENDRPRSGRPRLTSPREDRLLIRRAKRSPFTSAAKLRDHWPPGGRVSVRTVIRRLHNPHLRSRRPVKCPYVSPHHLQARLQWANDHLRWNIRNWQNIHWSDESRFILRPVDRRMCVWRQINTAYNENNIFPTSAFGSGGVNVWGCFSLRCNLDLYVLNGTMNGQMYRDSDNHPLASRPFYMDDNARPHRARIVNQYKQQEAIDTIPWLAMLPDMNPIEHVWDYIGQRLNHRNPQCQNLAELRTAIVEEWQNVPQYKLRKLFHSMKRRAKELFRKRGCFTHC